jgi:hypothetical protein
LNSKDISKIPDSYLNKNQLEKYEKKLPILPSDIKFPSSWNLDPVKIESVMLNINERRTKLGPYLNVPLECTGHSCCYKGLCAAFTNDSKQIVGQKCIIEISQIIETTDRYLNEFNLDPNNLDHSVDLSLVKDLVMLEILAERCTSILSREDIVEEMDVVISPKVTMTRKEINPIYSVLEKTNKQKQEILKLLNATRENKAKYDKESSSPAQLISSIMEAMHKQEAIEAEKVKVINVVELETLTDVTPNNENTYEVCDTNNLEVITNEV